MSYPPPWVEVKQCNETTVNVLLPPVPWVCPLLVNKKLDSGSPQSIFFFLSRKAILVARLRETVFTQVTRLLVMIMFDKNTTWSMMHLYADKSGCCYLVLH